jgi:hypothetical protein
MSAAAAPEAPAASRQAGPFSPVTVAWILGVALFAFAAFMVLLAYAPDLKKGNDGGGHALSKSAVGYAGLVRFLEARHIPVIVSRGRVSRRAGGLLILSPNPGASAEAVEKLKFDGPVLIVLPKWGVVPDRRAGWVKKAGLFAPGQVSSSLAKLSAKTEIVRRNGAAAVTLTGTGELFDGSSAIPLARIDQLQTLSGPDWRPLLVDDAGRTVLAVGKQAGVYVLSDPDILSTHGLKTLEGARAAAALVDALRAGQTPVVFDVTLNGFERSRSLLRMAFEPPFLGLTLCLLAAAAMMGWHAVTRFGAPRPPGRAIALGKRALADNSAALIRLAKREHQMAPRYVIMTRAFVARALGAPRDLDETQTDEFLDRIGRSREVQDSLADLAATALAARTPSNLIATARRLYRWRLEMTRERR